MNEIGVSEDAEGDGSVSAIGRSGSVGDDKILRLFLGAVTKSSIA